MLWVSIFVFLKRYLHTNILILLKQFISDNPKFVKTIKILLLVTTLGFIVFKLSYSYDLKKLYSEYNFDFTAKQMAGFVFVFLLMFVNWGLETSKWKLLINKYESINFSNAFKAVLSGVTLSVITPNQIGDFIGRVVHLQVLNKIKGSLVTIIGHTAQVIITGILGTYALLTFVALIDIDIYFIWREIALVLLAFHIIIIFLYIRFDILYGLLNKIKWLHKFEKYFEVFKAYSKIELSKVILISFIRYSVFVIQYYILLQNFGVQIPFITCIAAIVAVFCVQSIIPSFILIEIGLRGASAIFFFGEFSSNKIGILLSAYSLWMINMMLPALLGLFFIFQLKYKRTN
jgi:uncharacterized membrane protein YbhN (UPF0104 family)